ncbi:MAG: DUF2238 domain-containing protein [Candidatus Gracilibacteria bacterium]|nr:DUF2238 domain-containing protein [Candidatus Gracilibacteria bacterium]
MKNKINLFYILVFIYIIEFIVLAINPVDRITWIAENTPVVIIVGLLIATYKKFKFSNLAYIFMFVFIYLHTIGGHYTFANVPFGFITDLFGFERNHFDRIAHFTVGFYAYPFAELLARVYKIKYKFILFFFPLFFIISIAGIYEIIEWIYADLAGGQSGIAFLGSQGDIWDAQKDMLADSLGALFSMGVYFAVRKRD